MVDENTIPTEEKQPTDKEVIETYEFFSNPVKTSVTIFNGIKILLQKMVILEKKIDSLESKLNENKVVNS